MNPIKILSDIMLEVLKFFAAITGNNYGLGIIFLTVAVKLALYPLTLQSTTQMAAMQKLQPKLKELQEKHKDKPQEFQKKTMELYKKHGVNPLGGCLPMLLQLPFFIALFFALHSPEFKELISQPGAHSGFLWIRDLAQPDRLSYILGGLTGYIDKMSLMVILIALTTYWSQAMMPGAKAGGRGMMMFMPLFIAYISMYFPAGVQLYWVVSNLLTMAQQWYILRRVGP